jgi:MoaA/NifB/PqqE/SkfB family radical SAM enzyme
LIFKHYRTWSTDRMSTVLYAPKGKGDGHRRTADKGKRATRIDRQAGGDQNTREPIINSMHTLRHIPQYFSGKRTARKPFQCHHVARNFAIQPNVDVYLCFCQPTVGNIVEQRDQEIWYRKKAGESGGKNRFRPAPISHSAIETNAQRESENGAQQRVLGKGR